MRPDAHALVAAYAVDALEPDERRDVEEHLEVCDVCREDLRQHRETLATLATAAAEVPPARMRESVLARARATPQLPPDASGHDADSADSADSADDADGGDDRTDGGDGLHGRDHRDGAASADGSRAAPRQGAVSRTVLALAASVLALAAVGLGVWGAGTADRLADVRAQQAAVQRVLAAEDVVSYSARPQLSGGVEGDEVVVLASLDADAALLLPAGLPAAPAGSTWQAWTVAGDQAVSAGTFDVRGGEAVALGAGIEGVDAVAVSLEPAGGSAAPTSDPVLVVPLT